LQTWVGNFLVGDPTPRDPKRTLVVTFIGYGEIILWYSTLAFILNSNFDITRWQQALYFAIGTATVGSDIRPNTPLGFVIFSTQLMFDVLFLSVVVSRIIDILGKGQRKA
jgi:hypothetical protein